MRAQMSQTAEFQKPPKTAKQYAALPETSAIYIPGPDFDFLRAKRIGPLTFVTQFLSIRGLFQDGMP